MLQALLAFGIVKISRRDEGFGGFEFRLLLSMGGGKELNLPLASKIRGEIECVLLAVKFTFAEFILSESKPKHETQVTMFHVSKRLIYKQKKKM